MACTRPDGIGPSDMESTLETLRIELTALTSENCEDTLRTNKQVTERHFLQFLGARIQIFRVFLERALAIRGGITEYHKSRWLLL